MSKNKFQSALMNGFLFMGLKDVVQVVTTIVIARMISPEEFGVAILAQSIVIFLGVFSGNNVINVAAQYQDPAYIPWAAIKANALRVNYVLCSLIALLVLASLIFTRFTDIHIILLISILFFLIEPYGSLILKYYEVNHEFFRFRTIAFYGTILSAIVGISVAYLGHPLYALIFQSISFCLPSIFLYLSFDKDQFSNRLTVERNIRISEFYASKVVHNSVERLYNLVENLSLKFVFEFSMLGEFSRQKGFSSLVTQKPGNLILASVLPVLTRASKKSDLMKLQLDVLFLVAIFGLFGAYFLLAAFGEFLYTVLYGDSWVNFDYILPTALVLIITMFTKYFGFVLQVNGFVKAQSFILTMFFLINTILFACLLIIFNIGLVDALRYQYIMSAIGLFFLALFTFKIYRVPSRNIFIYGAVFLIFTYFNRGA